MKKLICSVICTFALFTTVGCTKVEESIPPVAQSTPSTVVTVYASEKTNKDTTNGCTKNFTTDSCEENFTTEKCTKDYTTVSCTKVFTTASTKADKTTVKKQKVKTTTYTTKKKTKTTTTTAVKTKKATTTTKKKSIDIKYYEQYAKDYAVSIGLSYDSTATDCWDNPIIVTDTNGSSVIRDIKSRLKTYKNVEGFESICVWSEIRLDGKYDLYIGYA